MSSCGKKQLQSLPAIVRPSALGDDRYSKSKLMTYTRSRERQKILNNIMSVFFSLSAKFISSLFGYV